MVTTKNNWRVTGWRYTHARHGSFHVFGDWPGGGYPVVFAPSRGEAVYLGHDGPASDTDAVQTFASLPEAMLAVDQRIAELDAVDGSEQLEACR